MSFNLIYFNKIDLPVPQKKKKKKKIIIITFWCARLVKVYSAKLTFINRLTIYFFLQRNWLRSLVIKALSQNPPVIASSKT